MAQREDNVLAELPTVGKYKVRIIESKNGPVLDVREYVESETFKGFTRKGIRIGKAEARILAEAILALEKTNA